MAGTLRAFVAVDLSKAVRAYLGEILASLSSQTPRGAVRWVRPEGIHLTLKFLGEIPEGSVQPLQAAISEAARGIPPFTAEVGGLGCFPNLTRPRVVWVGVDCPGGNLGEVQKRIEETAAACGFEREARAFSPHLTLGRVPQGESPATLRRLGEVVALFPAPPRQRLEVTEVCLFRSVLQPEGAQYTVLCHARLGGLA